VERQSSTANPRHECSPDAVMELKWKGNFCKLKLKFRLNYFIKSGLSGGCGVVGGECKLNSKKLLAFFRALYKHSTTTSMTTQMKFIF
jgi:hypothetical protein